MYLIILLTSIVGSLLAVDLSIIWIVHKRNRGVIRTLCITDSNADLCEDIKANILNTMSRQETYHWYPIYAVGKRCLELGNDSSPNKSASLNAFSNTVIRCVTEEKLRKRIRDSSALTFKDIFESFVWWHKNIYYRTDADKFIQLAFIQLEIFLHELMVGVEESVKERNASLSNVCIDVNGD